MTILGIHAILILITQNSGIIIVRETIEFIILLYEKKNTPHFEYRERVGSHEFPRHVWFLIDENNNKLFLHLLRFTFIAIKCAVDQ